MTNASRAKRKRAAVRSAKRSRNNTWWYALTAIVVVLGVSLIVYARATAPTPVGPFLPDANNPTKQNTHWHAALGVYDCDHWMGDTPGSGIWNWPAANASGQPSQAGNTQVYAGLHSHDDGVIHMEPGVSAETGRGATVGLYFQYGGWKISATGYSFLGTTVKNGDKCGTGTGSLQWEVAHWNGDTTGKVKQKYTLETGNPGKWKLNEGDVVVVAFLPPGKTLASIGDPPSVKNLATALTNEAAPGASATTVPPAVSVPTTVKPATGGPTTPTSAAPPTTKKP